MKECRQAKDVTDQEMVKKFRATCEDLQTEQSTKAYLVAHPEKGSKEYLEKQILDLKKRVELLEKGNVKDSEGIMNPTVFVAEFELPCLYKKNPEVRVWTKGSLCGYSKGSTCPYKVKGPAISREHGGWVNLVFVSDKDYRTHIQQMSMWSDKNLDD
jgi:hypothetical protein